MKAEHPLCSQTIIRNLTNGTSVATKAHAAATRGHQLKRSHGAPNTTDAFTQAFEWILEDGEEQAAEMTKMRCLKSYSRSDTSEEMDMKIMLEAINKNSPSLSLSFGGREKFLEMKRKIWHKERVGAHRATKIEEPLHEADEGVQENDAVEANGANE
jgi:hypothetical protein